MSTSVKSERRPRVYQVVALCFIFALAYVVSVGPVLTIAARINPTRTQYYKPLRLLYAPLWAVAESSPSSIRIYSAYLRLCHRIILNEDYPAHSTETPIESLVASVDSITNGQSSFEIFIPNRLRRGEESVNRDFAMPTIIEKVREHGLYPAGFHEQSGGRIYRFARVREWETNK